MAAVGTAVIVGGTDGLGQALAIRYLASGWRVVVLGRTDRRAIRDAGAIYLPIDLTTSASVGAIGATLTVAGVDAIDALIHCAALGWVGNAAAQSPASIDAMVAINIWAPAAITHQLLPWVERVHGRILFVGSIAAFVPAPHYAVYAASKAAIDGFARSLAHERTGRVTVQVIHPGPIGTAFHAKSGALSIDPSRFPSPAVVAERVLEAMGPSSSGERKQSRHSWRIYPDGPTAMLAGFASRAKRLTDVIVSRRQQRSMRHQPDPSLPVAVPVAMVTGAGSGLGAALTVQLINAGYRVIGIDRVPLESMAADRIARYAPLTADLSHSDGIARIAEQARKEGPLALLIHCAGTSAVGPFAAGKLAPMQQVLHTNLTGPMQLTARLLSEDRLAARAAVVFVSSLSHFVGYPGAAIYAASKDGLAHYARSIGIALDATGRQCLTVFPGPMRTPHAEQFSPASASDRYRVEPAYVAAKILHALVRRRTRLVIGRGARIAMLAGLIAPTLTTKLMRRILFEQMRGDAMTR
jgi:short-subunit dehydrogenase